MSEETSARQERFEALVKLLPLGSVEARVEKVQALREYGERAIEPLCRALEDKDWQVRAAAAESLGYVGDERVVPSLVEALQTCFIGRSARGQRAMGLVLIPAALLAVIVFPAGLYSIGWGVAASILTQVVVQGLLAHYRVRRSYSNLTQAVTDALARIAERHPTPELYALVPELKAISADVLQQVKETRAASWEAAARIERLTENVKNLPVAASMPARDTTALPRPAEATDSNAETLPRVPE